VALSDILSGNIIYADDVFGLVPISVQKGGSESRTSTTTQTVDSSLVLALPANTVWDFDFSLFLTGGNNAGDWIGHLEWPANATCSYAGFSIVDTVTAGSSGDLHPATRSSSG